MNLLGWAFYGFLFLGWLYHRHKKKSRQLNFCSCDQRVLTIMKPEHEEEWRRRQ